MKTAGELYQLLDEAENLPYGAAQIAMVEQVLRHADAAGDPELSFLARLIGTTAYVYGGEPAKAFVTFSWCVSDLDNQPQSYHQQYLHSLLWLFKTTVHSLTEFPEIPLERTHAVLDDMERRYREYGHGQQAVYKYRYLIAEHVGDREAADEWYERWQSAPRDELSDCVGCDPSDVAEHLAVRGHWAEAVEHADPVLAGALTCAEQPQRVLNELMVPYLLTGRPGDAADAHRRSYRVQRNNLADMAAVAKHIEFCARTGNEHRGLEILQRHVDWLPVAPSPAEAMEFSAAGGLLLRRVTELGHGDAVIRRQEGGEITAAALAVELTERATALARRFDERNRSTEQSRRVTALLTAEPFDVAVSLDPAARPAAARPAAPAPAPVPEIPAAAGPAELLDLAEQHAMNDEEAESRAVLAAFDARHPDAAALGPLLAGRRGALHYHDDWQRDPDAVAAVWERAIEQLTEAGATDEAAAVRGRLGLTRCLTGRAEEGLALVRSEVEHADRAGDARRRSRAWTRLAIAHFSQEQFAEAEAALDQAATPSADSSGDRTAAPSVELSGDRAAEAGAESPRDRAAEAEANFPRDRAVQQTWRARICQATGRPEEALAAARQAHEFFRAHGPAGRLAEVAVMLGGLADDPAEKLAFFTEAVETGVPEAALAARGTRGQLLLHLERPQEAIGDLAEAVALATEQGIAELSAIARHQLAQAYRMAGRPVEAAEVGEEALLRFEQLDMAEEANDCRFLLAGLYRDLDDRDGALALYRTVLTGLDDNPAGRGQVGEAAGDLLYDMDRDEEAAELFGSSAAALREAGDLIGEVRLLRRRIAALHYADEDEAAMETAARAEKLAAALPPEPPAVYQGTMIRVEVADMLLHRGEFAEAVPQLSGVSERLREIGAIQDAERTTTMLGVALLRSGRAGEAERVLGALLGGLAPNDQRRDYVTELLEEARSTS